MNKDQALKILHAVPVTSGYAYDLIQHITSSVEDPDDDEDIPLPSSAEAGDLFRVLVLDEKHTVAAAEEVYDAAIVIVLCADLSKLRLAS